MGWNKRYWQRVKHKYSRRRRLRYLLDEDYRERMKDSARVRALLNRFFSKLEDYDEHKESKQNNA